MKTSPTLTFPAWLRLGLAGFAITAPALRATPVFEPVQAFGPESGFGPDSALLQAADGTFYGTTQSSDSWNGPAWVYQLNSAGDIVQVAEFTDGFNPEFLAAPLIQAADGSIYGSCYSGGDYGRGYIYKVNPAGTLDPLVSFNFDQQRPNGIIQGADSDFYGATTEGGYMGGGILFKASATGSLTVLAEFDGTNGFWPAGKLIQTTDGSIYGVTTAGGSDLEGNGSVFKFSPDGETTIFAEFGGDVGDAHWPTYGLTQGTDGNFYGNTTYGGEVDGGGIYKITSDGTLTTIASLGIDGDLCFPVGELVQGPDGAFYGVATQGGFNYGMGGIFRVTAAGELSVVTEFDGTYGYYPLAGLTKGADGNLYGTNAYGGTDSEGTPVDGGQIFRIRFGAEVTTEEASGVSSSAAFLNGTVNPGGYETTVTYQYGTSPTLASYSTVGGGTVPAGDSPVSAPVSISGLAPATTYYFRVVAVNAETPVAQVGEILSFTTPEAAHLGVTSGAQPVADGGKVIVGWVVTNHSKDVTLTLTNTSTTATLTGIGASLSGGTAGEFSVIGAPAAALAPGASTTVTIRFSPVSSGIKGTTLTVSSSDPDAPAYEVKLRGAALTPAQARVAAVIRWILSQL